MIRNFPLNTEDSVIAYRIYRTAGPLLQGGIKRFRNPYEKVPIISLKTDISLHHKNIKLYFIIYIYEQNAFLTYKVIQAYLPHSRKLHLKEHIK